MYVSFFGLTLKQFFDIIQGEVRKNRSLKEHSGFATTAIHATRSASLRRFYLLTEKSQTCGLVSVLFQSLLVTLILIRPSSIGVWVELKPLFEEKPPWPLPVSSNSVQLTDSLVSGDMKLIILEQISCPNAQEVKTTIVKSVGKVLVTAGSASDKGDVQTRDKRLESLSSVFLKV